MRSTCRKSPILVCLFFVSACTAQDPERGSLTREASAHTCEGFCAGQAPGGCYCDDKCQEFGDCCFDVAAVCAIEEEESADDPQPDIFLESTCEGACGGQSPAGCYCDDACQAVGDCCPDYDLVCWSVPEVEGDPVDDIDEVDSTCQGACGAQSLAGCFCDSECQVAGDCCPDYELVCPGDPGDSDPSCHSQDAAGSGACELFLGWQWNGASCVPLSGCGCVGLDCGAAFFDQATCLASFGHCSL